MKSLFVLAIYKVLDEPLVMSRGKVKKRDWELRECFRSFHASTDSAYDEAIQIIEDRIERLQNIKKNLKRKKRKKEVYY
jgi:hypothetical protein